MCVHLSKFHFEVNCLASTKSAQRKFRPLALGRIGRGATTTPRATPSERTNAALLLHARQARAAEDDDPRHLQHSMGLGIQTAEPAVILDSARAFLCDTPLSLTTETALCR